MNVLGPSLVALLNRFKGVHAACPYPCQTVTSQPLAKEPSSWMPVSVFVAPRFFVSGTAVKTADASEADDGQIVWPTQSLFNFSQNGDLRAPFSTLLIKTNCALSQLRRQTSDGHENGGTMFGYGRGIVKTDSISGVPGPFHISGVFDSVWTAKLLVKCFPYLVQSENTVLDNNATKNSFLVWQAQLYPNAPPSALLNVASLI